jgi:hypothetical protein
LTDGKEAGSRLLDSPPARTEALPEPFFVTGYMCKELPDHIAEATEVLI